MLYRTALQRFACLRSCKCRFHCKTKGVCGESINQHSMGQRITRDHEVRTKGSFRQDIDLKAVVKNFEILSPQVKGLTLKVLDDNVSTVFKAGQWIDMTIPGVDVVGGFSICNSPYEFKTNRTIQIAVKQSDHPPAFWVHNKCSVNSEVTIRFGGDFFYEPGKDVTESLLLIAGGVGINPILSILKHRSDLIKKVGTFAEDAVPSTTILYSARTLEELIFKDNIEEICNELGNSKARFFITQSDGKDENMTHNQPSNVSFERISRNYLTEILQNTENNNLACYICGPPNFIDTMESNLLYCGLLKKNIRFEKWW